MSAPPSFGVDCRLTPEPSAPPRRPWGFWRVVNWVGAAAVAGVVALVVAHGAGHLVRESRRAGCAENLKRIGLAMHEYHNAHEHFPAPSLARGDGTPLLSWRVALLPHLGYTSLYERFHLDEPWDSPHNLALLPEMPREFACPGGPARRAGRTGYLVIVGPQTDPTSVNTPFEPTRGVDLREILDGTSSTILALETDAAIPWTRPDDLRWAPGDPPPRLASPHAGGAHAILADGAVRFLKATIERRIFLAILTINGSELTSDP